MGEPLISKLQKALLHHQASPEERIEKIEDPTLAFISSYLLDDTEDHEAEVRSSGPSSSQGRKRSLQDYLEELSSLIRSEAEEEDDPRYVEPKHLRNGRSSSKKELLNHILMEAARAVVANDARKVYRLVDELSLYASPQGSCHERIAIYFIEALVARLGGYGAEMFKVQCETVTSKDYLNLRMCQNVPVFRVMHVYSREAILQHSRGAKVLHIVDFGILHGLHWPSLMKALSELEHPPELKITGVEYPNRLDVSKTGRKLSEYARQYKIKFEFHGVSTYAWESVQPKCSSDEMLVINCNLRLRHLRDGGTAANNPRKLFFENVHKMRPHMMVLCVASGNLNTPMFLPRFQEALRYYTAKLEYFDSVMNKETEGIERIIRKNVVNVVACEGAEFVERLNSFEVWDMRVRQAGFEALRLDDCVSEQVRIVWEGYQHHENVVMARNRDWILLGWKDVVMYAMSAWMTPCEFAS